MVSGHPEADITYQPVGAATARPAR